MEKQSKELKIKKELVNQILRAMKKEEFHPRDFSGYTISLIKEGLKTKWKKK